MPRIFTHYLCLFAYFAWDIVCTLLCIVSCVSRAKIIAFIVASNVSDSGTPPEQRNALRVECGDETIAPVPMPVFVFVVQIDLGLRIVEEPFRQRGSDVGVRADEATAQPKFLAAFTDRRFGVPFCLFLVRDFNRLLFFRMTRVRFRRLICREERFRILAADTIEGNKLLCRFVRHEP